MQFSLWLSWHNSDLLQSVFSLSSTWQRTGAALPQTCVIGFDDPLSGRTSVPSLAAVSCIFYQEKKKIQAVLFARQIFFFLVWIQNKAGKKNEQRRHLICRHALETSMRTQPFICTKTLFTVQPREKKWEHPFNVKSKERKCSKNTNQVYQNRIYYTCWKACRWTNILFFSVWLHCAALSVLK